MPHTQSLVTSARILYLKLEDINNAQAFLAMPYLPLLSFSMNLLTRSLQATFQYRLQPEELCRPPLKNHPLPLSRSSAPVANPVLRRSQSAMHWPSPNDPASAKLRQAPMTAPTWKMFTSICCSFMDFRTSAVNAGPRSSKNGTWDDVFLHAWI